MKKLLFVTLPIIVFSTLLGLQNFARADRLQCQSNPKIGDRCTARVTIRLRKVESDGSDEYHNRFEPDPGWVIEDFDARSGERGRTGEVSGPTATPVQAGNTVTSSSYAKSQIDRVDETTQKLRAQFGDLPIYGEIENQARTELSNAEETAAKFTTSNRGLQIDASVAVEGGCHHRIFGKCEDWGPGGSLDTDVFVYLRYVGTNQDIDRIANKYIDQANQAKGQNLTANNSAVVTTDELPTEKNSVSACSSTYDPRPYRPGTSNWDGHVGKIAFNNGTNRIVKVTLYHPDAPNRQFGSWNIQPGANTFLGDNNYGMDWGIQVDNSNICILKLVSDFSNDSNGAHFQTWPERLR